MSKQVDWSPFFGCGTIICECDKCGCEEEAYEFDDNFPDYKKVQETVSELGWVSCKIHGKWHDFCSEECRNRYIKEVTR